MGGVFYINQSQFVPDSEVRNISKMWIYYRQQYIEMPQRRGTLLFGSAGADERHCV
jgi:hypothetical protein